MPSEYALWKREKMLNYSKLWLILTNFDKRKSFQATPVLYRLLWLSGHLKSKNEKIKNIYFLRHWLLWGFNCDFPGFQISSNCMIYAFYPTLTLPKYLVNSQNLNWCNLFSKLDFCHM